VNTTIPGVTILNDENNDGFINKVESDKTTGVSVKIEVPSGAEAGNTIKVSNGTTTINHPLTQAEVDAKSFTLTNAFAKPAEGATITVTAVLGNNTTGGSDSAKLDTSKFTDPVNPDPINPVDPTKSGLRVTINSDVNNDGFLSNSDLATADLVKATIALTTDAAVGDLLTVAITGNTTRSIILTAAHIAEKQVVLTGLAAPANGDTITVTATLQDVAGNSTPAVAFDSAKVNTAMPGVMITTDSNNDGLINSAELNGATRVAVRVEVPKAALVGDTVTVTDGTTTISHVLTDADVRDKVFTETFAKPAEGANITVTASFGGTTGTDTAKLDTIASNTGVGLGVSIDTDTNNDAFVNAAELGTSTTFNSRATFTKDNVEVGDRIDFTFTNGSGTPVTVKHLLTAADVLNGFVDEAFTKPTASALQTVTVNFVDKAGNIATDTKPTDNATLDDTTPNNEDVDLGVRIIADTGPAALPVNGVDKVGDNVVNAAELSAQRDINAVADSNNFISRASFTGTNAVVGHKIIFNASNGSTALDAQTITLTQADLDRGFVEVKFAKPGEGQTQTVTVMYADAAGNADTTNAPTDFASLDTLAPQTTLEVEVITDGANSGANDGFVNNPEIGSSTKYNVEARFESGKVAVGDKVQFTVGNTVTEVVIDQTMKTAGKVTAMFDAPTTNGESFTVKAVIKDAVGNSTTEAQDTVVRNKLIAVNDTAEVTAPTSSTPTTTPAANVISNDADPQFLPNPDSPAPLQVFVSGIKLSGASAFSAISNSIAGQFGSLRIGADGSYTYTVSNTAAVEALGANDRPVETFVYEVTDNVGNVSTATLAITVKGVNDTASHLLKDRLTLSINDSNTNPLIGSTDALLITDKDAGESALSNVATTGSTPFTGSFGTLSMTQSSHTATQTGYSYSYSKNATSGISDTVRHDLFTFNTQDGTDSVTFDIQLLNTSGSAATKNLYQTGSTDGLKIATASANTEDTLKLVGSQMTFDFTGTTASTDIRHIDVIDITGSGNNTIRLDLNSLTQADLSGGIHKLFIKGNTGDVVTFNLDSTPTPITSNSTSVVDNITYNVFKIGDDELLVQSTIASVTVNG
jgi:VCBS repeat-containing protein